MSWSHFLGPLCLWQCFSEIYPKTNLTRFDLALRTDRPVVGRPHTWALPTIYRFGMSQIFPQNSLVLGTIGLCQQYIGSQFFLKIAMPLVLGTNKNWHQCISVCFSSFAMSSIFCISLYGSIGCYLQRYTYLGWTNVKMLYDQRKLVLRI